MSEMLISKFTQIQHYVIKFVSDLRHAGGSQNNPVFSTNKTDCHNISEILLKVLLNITNINPQIPANVIHTYYNNIIQLLTFVEVNIRIYHSKIFNVPKAPLKWYKLIFVEIEGLNSIHKVLSRQNLMLLANQIKEIFIVI